MRCGLRGYNINDGEATQEQGGQAQDILNLARAQVSDDRGGQAPDSNDVEQIPFHGPNLFLLPLGGWSDAIA